jgi:hypothetical protein
MPGPPATLVPITDPPPLVVEQPTLAAATVQFKNGMFSSKKAPTRVTVQLRDSHEQLLAEGETVGEEYPDGGTRQLVLQPRAARRDSPRPYKLTVVITTPKDGWNFESTVFLRWTDGSVTTAKFDKMKLDEKKPSATLPEKTKD